MSESDSDLRNTLLRVARELEDHDRPESEYEALVDEWTDLCPHPGGTDILFWPNEVGLCTTEEIRSFEMSPEQMVDFAMSWEPRVVAMKIVERIGGNSVGFYSYTLEAPETPKTHVATALDVIYEKGLVLAVALKGVVFPDGSRVDVDFNLNAFSCGRILGVCCESPGTLLNLEDWPT